jgi:hypothetical protein
VPAMDTVEAADGDRRLRRRREPVAKDAHDVNRTGASRPRYSCREKSRGRNPITVSEAK